GGTLIEWVPGYRVLAQEMFNAGLRGSGESQNAASPIVDAKISAHPKQEVGRGLLAESRLEGQSDDGGLGLSDLDPPVTVGESGYAGLEWNGTLTTAVLKKMSLNDLPGIEQLTELNAFVDAFKTGQTTSAAAIELGLEKIDSSFKDHLKERLFGQAKGRIVTDIINEDPDALIEPLFVTEVKVLLETCT